RGARRVHAIDVGYGQLAWKLREDPRVRLYERQNIRTFSPSAIGEPLELGVVDVSFISLTLVLPHVARLVGPGRPIVAPIKPHFEAGRGGVGGGGVVGAPAKRAGAVEKVTAFARAAGWQVEGTTPSPIEGPAGNQEFLVLLRT